MNSIDTLAVNAIRTLAADAIQRANSGHPGLAIDAAPMAYALYKHMKHNPANPAWRGRDRFVLSAGHASMLEYALMHVFGYDVSIDDIKTFRQLGSKTAGHPEFGRIKGVEATTGPLGQGFAMAVGMAAAEKHMAAVFNREGFPVIDNKTYVIAGDGCMMEGIVGEAASIAGNLKLSKLCVLYDCNNITIEGSTDLTFTENVAARFSAYGWQVISIDDGENMDAVASALKLADDETEKPTLIIVKTKIAHGTPKEGSASSHGSPLGEENIAVWKKAIGWEYEPFSVPKEVYSAMELFRADCASAELSYDAMFSEYANTYPELAREMDEWFNNDFSSLDVQSLYDFEDKKMATRVCSGIVLNRISAMMPNLMGGSADLGPSNNTQLKAARDFSADCPEGRNIHFGIREFAMAAICNGMALYGGIKPFCATFLVFSDYLKPAIRLSALMKLGVIYIFTHDSIGVGEDGPTHQPIEQLDMLRATPNTYVFRPADGRETAAAYISALRLNMPAVMALSRQGLPQLKGTDARAEKGGYILREYSGEKLDVILMASGSEVELALNSAKLLEGDGIGVRVVSMPCMELFDEQSEEYRESVLPSSVRNRIAVEALGGMSWYKYIGLDGELISMKRFGASAPGEKLFEYFGFTVENVLSAARKMLNK